MASRSETASIIERAYQLARSGACRSIEELRVRLKAEGYEQVEAHLAGQSIRRDLRTLCAATHHREKATWTEPASIGPEAPTGSPTPPS